VSPGKQRSSVNSNMTRSFLPTLRHLDEVHALPQKPTQESSRPQVEDAGYTALAANHCQLAEHLVAKWSEPSYDLPWTDRAAGTTWCGECVGVW
jgi:hypothetical protein